MWLSNRISRANQKLHVSYIARTGRLTIGSNWRGSHLTFVAAAIGLARQTTEELFFDLVEGFLDLHLLKQQIAHDPSQSSVFELELIDLSAVRVVNQHGFNRGVR